MKEKKFIIVKLVTRKEAFHSSELQHCRFVAITRAGIEDVPQALEDERAVGVALEKGWSVLAVCAIPVPVPFAILNVEAVDSHRKFNASGFISVRLTTGRDFYNWVLGILTESEEVLDTDFWDELYGRYGLDDYFKHLVNSENVTQLEKHNIHATDFPDFGERLNKWFTLDAVDSFRIEPFDCEPSATLLRCIHAVNKAKKREEERRQKVVTIIKEGGKEIGRSWARDIIQALIKHPFKTLLSFVGLLVAFSIMRGCISSYSEEKEQQDEIRRIEHIKRTAKEMETRPVKGSLEVRVDKGADPAAASLLVVEAEAFARDAVEEASNKAKNWTNGGRIELPANKWADVATKAQRFAADSGGEYLCKVDGCDIAIVADASKVQSFIFDASALNGSSEMMTEISTAFGIAFSGKSVSDPKPVRKKTMLAGMEKIRNGHKMVVVRSGNTLTFMPDYQWLVRNDPGLNGLPSEEIISKAKEFWNGEAVEGFARYPREAADFAEKFKPLDRDVPDDFDDVDDELSSLSMSLEQEARNARTFYGKCNEEWLLFTAPPDRPTKMILVKNAAEAMDRLKVRVDGRLQTLREAASATRLKEGFEAEKASYKAASEAWWNGVAELITVYNRQVERKNILSALVNEIVGARERNDFSEIASFAKRIEDAKSERLAVAKDEAIVAQKVSPAFAYSYVDTTFGVSWSKRIRKAYASIHGAEAEADALAVEFSDKVINYFCQPGMRKRTLDKALETALAYADAVRYNHDARSVQPKGAQPSGTEVDFISRAEIALASLVRAQRRAAQGER